MLIIASFTSCNKCIECNAYYGNYGAYEKQVCKGDPEWENWKEYKIVTGLAGEQMECREKK